MLRFFFFYMHIVPVPYAGLKSLRTPSISSSSGSGGEKGVPDEEAFPRCPPAPLFSGIEDLPEAVLHSIQDHKKENIAIETPSSSTKRTGLFLQDNFFIGGECVHPHRF